MWRNTLVRPMSPTAYFPFSTSLASMLFSERRLQAGPLLFWCNASIRWQPWKPLLNATSRFYRAHQVCGWRLHKWITPHQTGSRMFVLHCLARQNFPNKLRIPFLHVLVYKCTRVTDSQKHRLLLQQLLEWSGPQVPLVVQFQELNFALLTRTVKIHLLEIVAKFGFVAKTSSLVI